MAGELKSLTVELLGYVLPHVSGWKTYGRSHAVPPGPALDVV